MIYFLVGYMGSGKSSIGRVLARRTGYAFVDMDKEIEQRNGRTITEIFAEHGEEYFRRQERELIDEIIEGRFVKAEDGAGGSFAEQTAAKDFIVATGGGVPCFGDNVQKMKAAGFVIYLRMSPEKLVSRLRVGKARRPAIAHLDEAQLLDYIRENLAARAQYYEQAGMTIDCDGVSDDYICRHIEGLIDYNASRNGGR